MYDGPVIDCDVHHTWVSQDELYPYLPRSWRDFISLPAGRHLPLDGSRIYMPSIHINRLDAIPSGGGPPGSDYELMRSQLLDPFRIEHAMLTYSIGQNASIPNLYLATEVVRAANDWTIEQWLSRDPRLCSAILLPTQVPDDAAEEIRRVGRDQRMIAALLVVNGLGKPFGHPVYHPIYEAAAEMNKPIAIHVGGELYNLGGSQHGPAGIPANRWERHEYGPLAFQTYLCSFITHGVFEKYPDLKVVFIESMTAWIPYILWELDSQYESLRRESPWVRRLPSEYFRDHVRVSTQPIDISSERSGLIEVLEAFGGMEDILLFATDYPHYDADTPKFLSSKLPAEWLPKVFYENARKLFGWTQSVNLGEPMGMRK
jgi:predicted TIM-barrel fold metal-dependent hydrolase